jgi:exopolysaccharide production protein ExoQ
MPFGFTAPIRYLAAGYFFVGLLLFARQTMPVTGRAWPLFILPVLCTMSALWAPVPAEAQRKGIALAMTGIVAIYAASRLSGRQILIAYFAAECIACVLSIAQPWRDGNGALTGIFNQKNFFAQHMFLLYGSALAITLDRANVRWLRLAALVMVPVSATMIIMAKSGTTTLLFAGATAVLAGQALIWNPASRIPHARTFVILLLVVIMLAVSLIAFGLLQVDAMDELLGALGKDSTLTGRTYLWEIAERTIAEHPWTGVGAQGFWRPEYGLANSITQHFDFPTYVGFSFHNSYLENGVNYGYPGYWGTVFLSTWALTSTGLNWIRNQSLVNAAFLVFAAMIVLRTTSEADLAGEFSGTAVLLFIGAARKEFSKRSEGADRGTSAPGFSSGRQTA